MLYTEINKKFTEAVAAYLSKGYMINTTTMSGSQGERARVDLTDGTKIITVFLRRFSEWEDLLQLEGWEIVVAHPGKQDALTPNCGEDYRTLWLGHVEVLSSERFYKIGRSEGWYGTRSEATDAFQKQQERWMRKDATVEYQPLSGKKVHPYAMEIAKRYIIRKRIAKRVDIRFLDVCKDTHPHGKPWYIVYKGGTYRLK